MLSIVVPVYNEQDNISPLYERVSVALREIGEDYEVILVNDGSTDLTEVHLKRIAAMDAHIKVVNFRRNFGQTAAMMAGIDFARGDIIVGLDGDLQNDPNDIPKLLAKLDEGYDVVSGWRVNRKDASLKRNLPSRMANWLISMISGAAIMTPASVSLRPTGPPSSPYPSIHGASTSQRPASTVSAFRGGSTMPSSVSRKTAPPVTTSAATAPGTSS